MWPGNQLTKLLARATGAGSVRFLGEAAAVENRINARCTRAGRIVQSVDTVMATIVEVNPIAVAFNLPQRDLVDFLAAVSSQSNVNVIATLPEEKKPLV